MQFAPEVRWRVSKRGLVLAAPDGETFLLEHPAATRLPRLVGEADDADELAATLGPPNGQRLVEELTEVGVLPGGALRPKRGARHRRPPRFALTRSGIEVAGIDRLAARTAPVLVPLLNRWPTRIGLVLVVTAGVFALLQGTPPGPQVTSQPAIDALLGFVVGLFTAFLHEFAHAVALAHYGRRPRRAGFGFYWGGISFYVDSTEALTLPRRQRVTQALVGLGVDVLTVSLLAITAQLSATVLISAVAWRLAVLGLLDIVVNLAPILEVDGHLALADYLDEPDLAPRARRALGDLLRRRQRPTPGWLAIYGAFSLVFGIALLIGSAYIFWLAAGELLQALFSGSLGEVVIGVLLVAPVAISLLLSAAGLILEAVLSDDEAAPVVHE